MQIKRLIPNLLTAGNLVGGILAIMLTLQGHVDLAPYCIFISAIFDFLDGFVARLLNVQSEMGKQLDSLADMVTFGVAPGIIMFELIRQHVFYNFSPLRAFPIPSGFTSPFSEFPINTSGMCDSGASGIETEMCSSFYVFLPYIALIIPVFALFRLAKFNLDTRQSSSFIGLPTPAMTIFVAALPLMILDGFESHGTWKFDVAQNYLLNPYFIISSSLLLSILMVVELPLFALKFKSFKFKGNEIRYIFLTISIILLATLFAWALPIIILLYIILSVINNLTKKQSKDEIQS
ncbi:MAG: CDP-diacylglycerol--serine O-phosphatidyltransferase [Arenicella sp.]|jgi:CDP-diacylglycerol--serine O-phosphatidyltransferase